VWSDGAAPTYGAWLAGSVGAGPCAGLAATGLWKDIPCATGLPALCRLP
jgi:hypothetical protein